MVKSMTMEKKRAIFEGRYKVRSTWPSIMKRLAHVRAPKIALCLVAALALSGLMPDDNLDCVELFSGEDS